jgi:hypothetical protein
VIDFGGLDRLAVVEVAFEYNYILIIVFKIADVNN